MKVVGRKFGRQVSEILVDPLGDEVILFGGIFITLFGLILLGVNG